MILTLLQNMYFQKKKKIRHFAAPLGQGAFLDGAKRLWLFLAPFSD